MEPVILSPRRLFSLSPFLFSSSAFQSLYHNGEAAEGLVCDGEGVRGEMWKSLYGQRMGMGPGMACEGPMG